jgi:hypothetical protein
MVQAVSFWLFTVDVRFDCRPVYAGYVVDKVAFGQVFL